MVGSARDAFTPAEGGTLVTLAEGGYTIRTAPTREILAIETRPRHPRDQELVGVRAGGASRRALNDAMGDIRGTPQFQVLDDFAGASLVAGWVWSLWQDDWRQDRKAAAPAKPGRGGQMVDICTGFAAGASSLEADGSFSQSTQSSTPVGPLVHPEDPAGWHPLPEGNGPTMRRARRLDLWRDNGLIRIDAGFQDSGTTPTGARMAIHEYRVHAEVEPGTMRLVALQALPLILPYRECPGASIKATRLIGQNVADLREAVVEVLPGTLGCTHLNDVLRGFADIPKLAEALP